MRGACNEVAAPGRPCRHGGATDAVAEAIGVRRKLTDYLGAHGPLRPEGRAELRRRDLNLDAITLRITLA